MIIVHCGHCLSCCVPRAASGAASAGADDHKLSSSSLTRLGIS